MTGPVSTAAPSGGVTPMSRRVMNLAHLVTQNARRHGDRIGFIWGEKSWTWREIDDLVSALAAALAARGVVKGDRILVHSKNCEGKGLLKKGDKVVKCQRCGGTGFR